jgi:hypothetical protein
MRHYSQALSPHAGGRSRACVRNATPASQPNLTGTGHAGQVRTLRIC